MYIPAISFKIEQVIILRIMHFKSLELFYLLHSLKFLSGFIIFEKDNDKNIWFPLKL